MNRFFVTFVCFGMFSLLGCLSIGNRESTEYPTMADEIEELESLKEVGTISAREFEQGKRSLLNQHHKNL